VTVGGGSGYWGRYNSPFYLRGDREDIGDYHKKDVKGELLKY
jgi:hypothetical protein